MTNLTQGQNEKVEKAFAEKNKPEGDGADIGEKGTSAVDIMGALTEPMNAVGDALYQKSGVAGFGASDTTKQIRDTISDAAIKSGNPYAMAIGLATKAVDGITDATGLRAADYTNDQLDDLGVGSDVKAAN